MNIYGDLLPSGNVTNPSASQVLVDTGALASGAPDDGFYNLNFILTSSIAATFEIGCYQSDDSADRVLQVQVMANETRVIPFLSFSAADGEKFKIISVNALIGVVNVGLNLQLIAEN